jgi:hypothetical protein
MYGTDFPMPLPMGGWTKYYQQMLDSVHRNPGLAPFENAIFRGNAAAFLNLGRFINERGADLTSEQRSFLSNYA